MPSDATHLADPSRLPGPRRARRRPRGSGVWLALAGAAVLGVRRRGAAPSPRTHGPQRRPAPPGPAPQRRRPVAPPATSGARGARVAGLAVWLGALGVLDAAVLARALWPAAVLAAVGLAVLPGLLALRALRCPPAAVLRFPVYVPALSLVVLTAAALVVDLAGPRLGDAHPLRTPPLLASVDVACIALAAVAAVRRPVAPLPRPLGAFLPRARALWPLVLPLAAVAGAARIDAGRGNALALAALVGSAAALVGGLAAARRASTTTLAIVLYGAGLALILSFSMRGAYVFGWDVSGEYATFSATLGSGVWERLHPDDAYGAMLSLTVLPAAVKALLGVPAATVFKLAYPLLLATFPCAVFLLARRVVAARGAYLAGAFVVVQDYFLQQMPAIARQEIALVLFVALVAAITDRRLPAGPRRGVIVALACGIAVSHYSTAYMTIGFLALALAAEGVLALLRRPSGLYRTAPLALLTAAVAAFAWYGPITHSASNASSFVGSVRKDGLHLLPNGGGKGLVDAYLRGNTDQRITAPAYAQRVERLYATTRSWVVPLPAAATSAYPLVDDPAPTRAGHPALRSVVDRVVLGVEQLANLVAVVGVVALALRRRRGASAALGALGVATLGLLVAIRLSGTVAVAYNQQRLLLQSMAVLAVAIGFAADWLARRVRIAGAAVFPLAGVALVALLLWSTGALTAIAGGGYPANLYDRGEAFERYHVSAPEVAAARFVGRTAPHGVPIYADRYAQLRLIEFAGRGSSFLTAVTPATLDQHAWVFASRANVVDGRARDGVDLQYSSFRFPAGFLGAYYDRPYANDDTAVYRR